MHIKPQRGTEGKRLHKQVSIVKTCNMYNSLLKLVFIAYLYVYTTEAKRCYGSANYTLTRRGTWTLERHPNSPLLRGFSPTVGCSHNYRYVMWRAGIKATTGVKDLSEMGMYSSLYIT